MTEVCLGEISDISYGYTAKAIHADAGPKFLRITDIQNGKVDWNHVPTCEISQIDFDKHRLKEGDIVFARTGATTGKSYRIMGAPRAVPASYLIRVRIFEENIDPKFVEFFFQTKTYWDMVALGMSGSAQGGFNASKLAELKIPLLPLDEQKRIVAILDEAFASIATAIANTEKNLANARELFESYSNSALTTTRKGWKRTTLGNEISLQTGFAFKSKEYTKDSDGIPLLRGDNIIQGKLRWTDHEKWPRLDAKNYQEYELRSGDTVLAMDRTWVKAGLKYAQISNADLPCLLVQRVARLRSGANLDGNFLKHVIGSNEFTAYVLSIQTGLGVPHISGKQISDFTFYLPPLDEQISIAARIEEMADGIQRVEHNYQKKLAGLTELKQSLLQKAFSGELTATPSSALEAA